MCFFVTVNFQVGVLLEQYINDENFITPLSSALSKHIPTRMILLLKKKSLQLISSHLSADCRYRNKMANMQITQVELKCTAPKFYRHLTLNIQVPKQLSFCIHAQSNSSQPSQDIQLMPKLQNSHSSAYSPQKRV